MLRRQLCYLHWAIIFIDNMYTYMHKYMIVVMRLSQLLNLITRFSSVYLFYVCIYMIDYLFELGLKLVGLYVLIIAFICCLLSKKILREGAAWENYLRACCKNIMYNANLYYKLMMNHCVCRTSIHCSKYNK